MPAAGIAPARITELLTMANPRKIYSPSPPAPIAAAMVDDSLILAGAIPAAILALLADFGVGRLEKSLRPQ